MSTDLTIPAARDQRDALATRTDVLDKVGILATLPDDMHCTTDMVSTYYEVDREAIASLVKRNREEFEDDGYAVVIRSTFEERFSVNLSSRSARIALFPRRAVLRIGMLLRDSAVARQVRDYLLDTEEQSPARRELSEDEIIRSAVRILDGRVEALTQENQQLAAKVEHDAPLVAKAEAHTASTKAIHRQEFAREVQGWGQKIHGIRILQKHVFAFLAHKGMTIGGNRSDSGHATAHAIQSGWAWTDKGVSEDGYEYATTKLNPRGQDVAWKWITSYVEANGTLELPRQIHGGDAA